MKERKQTIGELQKEAQEKTQSNVLVRLEQEGYIPKVQSVVISPAVKSPEELVRIIRNTRAGENNSRIPKSGEIDDKIREISFGNKMIDYQVRRELMGLQEGIWNRGVFFTCEVIDKALGKTKNKPEDLIKMQIEKINEMTDGLDVASRSIDRRCRELEEYHRRVEDDILLKSAERTSYGRELSGISDLLIDARGESQNEKDLEKRVLYERAIRGMEKEMQSKMGAVTLVDKKLAFLLNETPMLKNLASACQSYSTAIKLTGSDAKMMGDHLSSVMGLYIDMMRAGKMNPYLGKEVGKLFVYTENMSNSLKDGALKFVKQAGVNSAFGIGQGRMADALEDVSSEMLDYNSGNFRNLEGRILRYLNNDSNERGLIE